MIKTFKQAEAFLALHIPKTSTQTFPGELGLNRAKYFLHLLGNPQEKLKIIHVAGTSGKGSTCYLISSLLISQGFKVGLHQSPHLTDVTERFQINNQIISKKEFVFYLNKIIPVINLVGKTFYGQLSYFEILVGMAFLIFSEKKIDYAVMETGLGGKYDGTNVVLRQDKLSVLTKIGLDHIAILGKTIEKIAYQKAMIINKNSQVISINQDLKTEKIIRDVAEKKMANVMFVRGRDGACPVCTNLKNMNKCFFCQFKSNPSYKEVDNLQKFITPRKKILNRDKTNVKKKVGAVFQTAHFPGRFDIKKITNKIVVFDGAHNPQKMKAFVSSLIKEFPNKKFNFLLAFKKGKDYQDMLKIIISLVGTSKIILTSFFVENQDMINASEDPAEIGRGIARDARTGINFEIIPDLKEAWETILKEDGLIVVTGSLYLVGEIFRLIRANK